MSKKEIMNTPIPTEVDVTENMKNAVKIYSIEEVKEADKHAKKITTELGKAEKAFTQVACEIAWLYENDRYKALETASTFEQFVVNRFGLKKTQAYGLVAMVNRFGSKGDDGTYVIDDKYKKYSHTKLILMCNARLTDEEIFTNIQPTMTVAEIKKAIKNLTAIEACDSNSTANVVDNTVQEASDDSKSEIKNDDSNVVDVTATVHNSQALVSYDSFEEFEADSENFFNLVANAFRTGKGYKVSICYEW